MREIFAYECADGKIFKDEKKATAHDDDLLGAEIDGLLKLYALDISRNQEFKGCLSAMAKRESLRASVSKILEILNHSKGD